MKIRSWVGSVAWVILFSLIVGLIALFIGIGYALAILCLRHILWGIPTAFGSWVRFIYGPEEYKNYLAKEKAQWPNSSWIISSLIYVTITAVVLIMFNIKLLDIFVK